MLVKALFHVNQTLRKISCAVLLRRVGFNPVYALIQERQQISSQQSKLCCSQRNILSCIQQKIQQFRALNGVLRADLRDTTVNLVFKELRLPSLHGKPAPLLLSSPEGKPQQKLMTPMCLAFFLLFLLLGYTSKAPLAIVAPLAAVNDLRPDSAVRKQQLILVHSNGRHQLISIYICLRSCP